MQVDAKLVVSILQFLFSIYNSRRDRSKTPSDGKGEGTDAEVGANPPSPERLKDLIREVEEEPKQTEESLSAAIDEKFPPEQAKQVKDDFAAFTLLVSRPNFADYDFYGVIQKYVKGVQAIAIRAELFRLRGWENPYRFHMLPMRESVAALAAPAEADAPVYSFGEIVYASVKKYEAFLSDEREDVPLLVFVEGAFTSYTSYGGERTQKKAKLYRFGAGQEKNWLRFYGAKTNAIEGSLGFRDFTYRLGASDVKAILTALKKDIGWYLRDIEEERPLVREVQEELKALWKFVSPETQS